MHFTYCTQWMNAFVKKLFEKCSNRLISIYAQNSDKILYY